MAAGPHAQQANTSLESSNGEVACPVCNSQVALGDINRHLDSGCRAWKRARVEVPSVKDDDGMVSLPATAARHEQPQAVRRQSQLPFGKVTAAQPEVMSSPGQKAPLKISGAALLVPTTVQSESSTAQPKRPREPLAERQRPRCLEHLIGQDAFGPGKPLSALLEEDRLPSLVLWGPPGCGKTSIAHIVRQRTSAAFRPLSAVTAGVKEVREVVDEAAAAWRLCKRRTILFLDECHRFNKAQQDVLLPHIESGTLLFVGATTENPSFSLNAALLSRCRVVQLQRLQVPCLEAILRRALDQGGLGATASEEVVSVIARLADGDARVALNTLELACSSASTAAVSATRRSQDELPEMSAEIVGAAFQRSHLLWDRKGDQHYDVVSALHKSIRGSDVDAAIYWLARQLESGEDPRYVARRLIRAAAEDIGLAEPRALEQAVAAHHAVAAIGMPEANVVLAQAVAFLARAPKSAAVYRAYNRAAEVVRKEPNAPPPLWICNAPTPLMRQLGYGAGYIYPPDNGYPVKPQQYLPEALHGHRFFDPADRAPEAPELAFSSRTAGVERQSADAVGDSSR